MFYVTMFSTWPWKRPASCTVLSGLFSCSYVLLMYLFHSRVSLSAGISNSRLISFSMVSANTRRQRDQWIDLDDVTVTRWVAQSLTDGVGFAEMTSDHVVHVVVLTQVELQQVNLNFTVFDKHAVFDNLENRPVSVSC